MDIKEIIESGKLELYVYGMLDATESKEIAAMAAIHPEINDEIISIEKGMISLSSSFSPNIPSRNYDAIKQKLNLENPLNTNPTQRNFANYLGWAASIIMLVGAAYFYSSFKNCADLQQNINKENAALRDSIQLLKTKNVQYNNAYAVVKDPKKTIVTLAGQQVAPLAKAKIYWSKNAQNVYVDATELPKPPLGKVYQVWALTLDPLTPTSIGLLSDFDQNEISFFELSNTTNVQAFGITLEPTGGSKSPTMAQLYTLGKI